MPKAKGGKNSASAGTRKKHAAKKARDDDDEHGGQQQRKPKVQGSNGKKLSKAQRKALPKIKQYIPPPKPPAPPIPDPLDAQGLARTLPADLVVILRRLGKKDDVTRRKGLDEFREHYVSLLLRKGGNEAEVIHQELAAAAVEAAIPVWLHNLASLLQSPFHRSQALQLHNELLSVPALRGVNLDSISMAYLPGTQGRDILGSWIVATLEEGRRSGAVALRTLDEIVSFGQVPELESGHYATQIDIVPHLPELAEYFSLSTLDPATLHRDIHPAPVQSVFTPQKTRDVKGKGVKGRPAAQTPTPTPPPPEEDEEIAEERWARYRVGGLVGLAWLVQRLAKAGDQLPEGVATLLHNPVLWSALGNTSHLPDLTPIGQQPPIRRAAYQLLTALIDSYPAEVAKPELLQLLAATVLGNCWSEQSAVVWEAAGSAVIKFLTKFPQSWTIAAECSADDEDDDHESDEEDEHEEAEATEPPSRAESDSTPQLSLSSHAFDAFLEFISTICPSVPHLTYVFLVVVVSTLPPTLLPLTSPQSIPLQNLFSHLWSPVDARMLSTQTIGAQQSAFQAFLKAAVDITVYLAEKAHGAGNDETVSWLLKDQFGTRVWGEGVAQLGGKGGRRGAPSVETEAKIAADAAHYIVSMTPELTSTLMDEIERTTLKACFEEEKHSFLSRALNALSTLREGDQRIQQRVDAIIVKIADSCSEHIFHHLSEGSKSAATLQAQALVEILTARPDLFPPERVEVLSQSLQAHIPEIVTNLAPATAAALFDATTSAASESERSAFLSALWTFVESEGVEQSTRFGLAAGMLESGATGLLPDNSLDTVATEAARAALATDDATALTIATKAIVNKSLSASARSRILSSASDVVHEAVDGLLSDSTSDTIPTSALTILAKYAEGHLPEMISADEYIQSIVAVHHLVVLLPRLDHSFRPPESASKIWSAATTLPVESAARLSKAVSSSLADLLGRVTCRVDPGLLVDVALASDLGAAATAATVANTLLPPPDDLLAHLSRHTAQPPNLSLPVIDPLVPCSPDDEPPITRPSDFDTVGRSRAARYAEAGLALLRADRSLVQTLPFLLHVALAAMLLAQDGAAVPGASRGLYTPETPTEHLEQVVRDAEGALSFSLSLVDEAPLAWHKATVEQLRAGQATADADYLQRLLTDLRADVATKTSDIAPRAFREVLSRHLRKCGAGEAEGEVWLNYAMAMSDKRRSIQLTDADLAVPDISLAVILAINLLMQDSKAMEKAQNRLANALTGISVENANERGLPALRLLIASAPPPDSVALFLPQQRAVFVLRHIGGWLTSEDEAVDDLADEIDVRVAEMYTALAPIVQDLSGAHWDAIFDLISGALGSCSLEEPATYPLMYASLSLLKEVRNLCASNKSLRALWTQKDEHLSLVVTLFLQARDADSEPLRLIHALILELLTDASPSVMAAAGLAELCSLLRLSTSASIQTTAYRLLSQVINSRTKSLVLEVEAAVVAEDEAAASQREIKFPPELVEIVEAGRGVIWEADLPVQAVMAQLLAWMAIMNHFDDAVG